MESSLGKGMDMMVIPNRGRVVAVISALALAGGLLMLTLLAKPSQAQPPTDKENGAVSEQFPAEFGIDSSCAGEVIDVTGTLHTVNHFTVQEDGTYHVNSHFNLQNMKGVGQTTGETYVIASAGNAVENFVQPGQIVTGTVDINLVIGKGQSPDQVGGFARVFFIIDDEGGLKVENIQFHLECHE
jgi:hypothetical protein